MALRAEDDRLTEATARLLKQMQIAPEQREGRSAAPGRSGWVAGAMGLALLASATVAVLRAHAGRFEVEITTATAPLPESPTGAWSNPTAILQATGYVTARRQATVSAQVTGILAEVLIEEGEHVQAGQVLARLEDSAQKAAVAQARAQLEAIQAVLEQYDVQLTQAQRDLARYESLRPQHLVSEQAFESAQTQVRTLKAQVDSQRRQVQLAAAAVRGAEVQRDYTTVRAPFAGVIVAKAAQAGEIVSPVSAGGGFTRTGVGTIVDMDSLEIEVDINEAYINRVKPNQPAQATLDPYPDWTIPAHVIAIVPAVDRSKATVKVRIGLGRKDPRILPDMGVRVSFLEPQQDKGTAPAPVPGVLVPASAIVSAGGAGGGSVIYAVADGRAHARAVTPGQVFGELRSVTGIDAGTRVVRAPPSDLTDGARVTFAGAEK